MKRNNCYVGRGIIWDSGNPGTSWLRCKTWPCKTCGPVKRKETADHLMRMVKGQLLNVAYVEKQWKDAALKYTQRRKADYLALSLRNPDKEVEEEEKDVLGLILVPSMPFTPRGGNWKTIPVPRLEVYAEMKSGLLWSGRVPYYTSHSKAWTMVFEKDRINTGTALFNEKIANSKKGVEEFWSEVNKRAGRSQDAHRFNDPFDDPLEAAEICKEVWLERYAVRLEMPSTKGKGKRPPKGKR